ncbi:MAG: hypothetical protein SGPRY_001967, partial [Prymnesium sp.]
AGSCSSAEMTSNLVLVTGPAQEKREYCESLAARVGGTVLSMETLVRSVSSGSNSGNHMLLAMVQQNKLVSGEVYLKHLAKAMESAHPPYILNDNPRMLSHLDHLERAVGEVGLAMCLHTEGEAVVDKEVNIFLKPLRDAERVVHISLNGEAISKGEEALRAAGIAVQSQESALVDKSCGGPKSDAKPEAKPAEHFDSVGNLVLVCGAVAQKQEYCEALAAKVGGSVLSMDALITAAPEAGEDGDELLSLLQRNMLIPIQLHIRLLSRLVNSLAAPYLIYGFPRMPTHLEQLEAAMGRVSLAVHLHEEGESEDQSVELLLKPLRETGRVSDVSMGPSALSRGLAALRGAGVPLSEETTSVISPRAVNKLVLVAGAWTDVHGYCASLAERVGGSVLSMDTLVALAPTVGVPGAELLSLLEDHKLVPVRLQIELLTLAIELLRPPYLLCGFPRILPQLRQLQKAMGEITLALHLRKTGESTDRTAVMLLSPLQEAGRVIDIAMGESALTEGVNALRNMGLMSDEDTRSVEIVTQASGQAPEMNKNLALLVGTLPEKSEFSQSLAARFRGSVLCVNEIVSEVMSHRDDDEQLSDLLPRKKLLPTDVQVRLLGQAMSSTPPPYLVIDFPRMPAQLQQLEAAFGLVLLAVHAQHAGEETDVVAQRMLKPLQETDRVAHVTMGCSALSDAEAALRAAGFGVSATQSEEPAAETALQEVVRDEWARDDGKARKKSSTASGVNSLAACSEEAAASPPEAAAVAVAPCMVVVVGLENAEYGASLAARAGGSALHLDSIVAMAGDLPQEATESKKMLPLALQVQLLVQVMATSPPPHVLCGFPTTPYQLMQLEASAGAVVLAVHLRREGESDRAMSRLLKPLEGTGRVAQVTLGPSALSDGEAALRAAGIAISRTSPEEVAQPSKVVEQSAPAVVEGCIVIVVGAENEEFGTSLAARAGGSALQMDRIVSTASDLPGCIGQEVSALLEEKKILPIGLQIRLLGQAMSSTPPPHFVCGFPRMPAHLKQLEAALGPVVVAVHLHREGERDVAAERLLKPLQETDRVAHVTLGASALSDGEAVLRKAGIAISRTSPEEVAQPSKEVEPSAPAVVEGCMVIVVGAENEEFGTSLASRAGGSALQMDRILSTASDLPGCIGQEVSALLEEKKILPIGLQIRLLGQAMSSTPPPHYVCGFPRMPAHLKQLEAALGPVVVAVHLHREGERDVAAERLLKPLQETDRVAHVTLGASALSDGEAVLRKAGVSLRRSCSESFQIAQPVQGVEPAAQARDFQEEARAQSKAPESAFKGRSSEGHSKTLSPQAWHLE